MGTTTVNTNGPARAGGAAMAGLAAGALIGAGLRARRRPRVLGLPLPRTSELVRSGRWAMDLQQDLRAVREQAEQSRRQSPIEVVLSALTSRRLPRHGGPS